MLEIPSLELLNEEQVRELRDHVDAELMAWKEWLKNPVTKAFFSHVAQQITGRERVIRANPIKSMDAAFEASYESGELRGIVSIKGYPEYHITELKEALEQIVARIQGKDEENSL